MNYLLEASILCWNKDEAERYESLGIPDPDSETDLWAPVIIDLREVAAIRQPFTNKNEIAEDETAIHTKGADVFIVNLPFWKVAKRWKEVLEK